MKHRFLTLISSLLLLTACSDSFLERAPEGNYVDVTYYISDDALERALHRFTTVHGSTSTPAPSCRWAVTVPTITSVAGELPVHQLQGDSPERKPCQCMDRFLLGRYNGQCSYQ